MTAQTDTPFARTAAGTWDLLIHAGRVIVWGHAFDPERGFRVFLAFQDSTARNTISAADTRRIADEKLDPRAPDQAHLAAELRKMAEQVEALNQGWEAIGRPADALNSLPIGHA